MPGRALCGETLVGDIGIPPVDAPMDFSAWFEVYLGGHWHTFDARHNFPRIGRILMARGRDATDVALSTIFGPSCQLKTSTPPSPWSLASLRLKAKGRLRECRSAKAAAVIVTRGMPL